MSWILVAVSGYFLNAFASVFDKFLLHERIGKPAVYAFFVAVFSGIVVLYLPFARFLGGFHYYGLRLTAISLLSGVLMEYSYLALYSAIKKSEISRVAPMVLGVVSPLSLIIISFLFFQERLGLTGIMAAIFLLSGGALVSLEFPLRRKELFDGFYFTLIAGFLMAVSFVFLKITFHYENFLSAFVWNRWGSFLGGFSFLLIPALRRDIVNHFKKLRSRRTRTERSASTMAFFVLNKIIGGLALVVINYAQKITPSISLVQALGSTQFAFVLLLATPLSFRYPHMFQEKRGMWNWVQKIGIILLIALGLVFISAEGKAVLQ